MQIYRGSPTFGPVAERLDMPPLGRVENLRIGNRGVRDTVFLAELKAWTKALTDEELEKQMASLREKFSI